MTVNHNILSQLLSNPFCISGKTSDWLCSLHDHAIMVIYGSSRSLWVSAPYCLPQGSVL